MLFVLHSGWTSKIRKPCKKIGDWLILPIPFRRPTNSDRVVNIHVPRWDQFLPCPSKTLKVKNIYTQYSSRCLSNKKVGSCQFWPKKTILRIKKSLQVCLYSSYDMVCWVPLGGIAGSCVGFIRSGEKRTLTLPRPWRGLEARLRRDTILQMLLLKKCWNPWIRLTRWWFRICFIFTPTWGNHPIWLMFFKWVETTN